jgi:hypothetical protein
LRKKQYIRPSQIITTFGPGSIVDLPDDSVMIAGIEHWPRPRTTISEPRLQVALGVREFRPPATNSEGERDIPYIRFPLWRVCPQCNRLSDRFRWPDQGRPDLPPVPRCNRCDQATYPARIIVACPNGHIDDFPWHRWVHRERDCRGGDLFLQSRGQSAALGDLVVVCGGCPMERPLSGALGGDSLRGVIRCSGKRPWLGNEREACDSPPRALQRGASNVYFSVVRSALSIPPWSDLLQAEVASWWGQFRDPLPEEHWRAVIQARFPDEDPEEVIACIRRLLGLAQQRPSIRQEEYHALLNAGSLPASRDFEARDQPISPAVGRWVSRLVTVPRLREVRALLGFTRIRPPEMDPTMEIFEELRDVEVEVAPIARIKLDWLPAVENRGEGIFLQLNLERLQRWEAQEPVRQRSNLLIAAYSAWRQERGLPALREQPPRLILLHTLAHLLIRYLSLDCGYSSASLRERIYSDERMAGLLIYTSSTDSDGSLGGLVRQTWPPERFADVMRQSVELARICASDPLCREHDPSRTRQLNGASCHACTMVSETSCEFGNRLLDRMLVVGLPVASSVGFFDYADGGL